MFKLFNVNPRNKKTGDCSIRAIALAVACVRGVANLDDPKSVHSIYEEVRNALYAESVKSGYVYNDKHVYEKVLERYGFTKYPQPRKADNTKFLVEEAYLKTCRSVIIISLANHLTCMVNRKIYDLWDCSYKTIGNYWTYTK